MRISAEEEAEQCAKSKRDKHIEDTYWVVMQQFNKSIFPHAVKQALRFGPDRGRPLHSKQNRHLSKVLGSQTRESLLSQ